MITWYCLRTRPVYSTDIYLRPDQVDPLSSITKGMRYQKTLHMAKINVDVDEVFPSSSRSSRFRRVSILVLVYSVLQQLNLNNKLILYTIVCTILVLMDSVLQLVAGYFDGMFQVLCQSLF